MVTGEGNGNFNALNARTGALLWQVNCGAGVNAPPISYEIDGRQYVVIVCGGGKNGAPSGSSIVAFALPAS